jgi:hypothetical protein
VVSSRGAVFIQCARSRTDPGYSRYPRLPMLACRGFEPQDAVAGKTEHRDADGADQDTEDTTDDG